MLAPTTRGLPGIRFEARPARLEEALPRMDVAVFAGFAASGPLHTPVAVEDAKQYEAVFGADQRLAWDRARGRWVQAHLASAVRSFFANGGRRCWVIRVAGEGAACNTFPVPGLMLARFGKNGSVEVTPALALATSEGSWSDGLQVSARLNRRLLRIEALQPVGDGCYRLELVGGDRVAVGDLVRVHLGNLGEALLAPVASVEPAADGTARGGVTVQTGRGFRLATQGSPPHPSPIPETGVLESPPREFSWVGHLTADVVSFDLRARLRADVSAEARNLGFSLDHPRAWSAFEADAEFYRRNQAGPGGEDETGGPARRRQGLDAARFPLAPQPIWDSPPMPGEMRHAFFFPWEMAEDFGEKPQGALPVSGDALQRDGLSAFNSALFLDSALADATAFTIMEHADLIRYQGPAPRPLRGMHAALGWNDSPIIDEATIIAVPDAVHRPWKRSDTGSPPADIGSPPIGWFSVLPREDSDKAPEEPAARTFTDCAAKPVPTPAWGALDAPDATGTFRLRWRVEAGAAGGKVSFTLEESALADFSVRDFVLATTTAEATIYGRAEGEYFYRVRAEANGTAGEWSQRLRVYVAERHDYEIAPDAATQDTLTEVHSALLRMCAGRGDLLAVLALPEDFHERDALHYAERLRAQIERGPLVAAARGEARAFYGAESRALSYGALYHPWLVSPLPGGGFRSVPPDGAACGTLALRSRERGAWVAPANEALGGVVSLAPPMGPEHWLDLQEARINIVRQEPRGFMVLNADTLSGDPDLRPIHVRRLLILLRRLALRLGAEFVFEPLGGVFRRLVQRRFELLLTDLFRRGAFAGARAEDSFQVVAGEALNTPQSTELGRFIVELKVRPAQALRFITVRLTQTGSRATVTEGG